MVETVYANGPEEVFLAVYQREKGTIPLGLNDVVAGAIILYCRRERIQCTLVARDLRSTDHGVRNMEAFYAFDFDPKIVSSDPILSGLKDYIPSILFSRVILTYYDVLWQFKDEDFNVDYPQFVDSFIRSISVYVGRQESVDYIQPSSVTEILSYFMKKAGVKSIYNPFAGLCSYPIAMGADCEFYAQEINPTTLALAKIRLHSRGLNPDNIVLEDSVVKWKEDCYKYDAIVASVPFGLLINPQLRKKLHIRATVLEDMFFLRAMGRDDSIECRSYPRKFVATIVPMSFTSRPSSARIREQMCKDGSLETVISLPEGIFPNTSVRTAIVILNPTEKHNSVRFVDATSFVLKDEQKNRRLDWERVITVLESNDIDYIKTVSFEEMSQQEYILNSDNYLPAGSRCDAEHEIIRLSDVMERVSETRITEPLYISQISEDAFSRGALTILHPRTDLNTKDYLSTGYSVSGPCILFMIKNRQVLAYVHKSDTDIAINRRIYAYKITSDRVSLEYMALFLLKDHVFCRNIIESSAWVSAGAARHMLIRDVIIAKPSLQSKLLKIYEDDESAKLAQLHAIEEARYGIKKAGSDIAHILATPFQRQNRIIRTLATLEPGSEKYVRRVTSLIDVCQYIRRMTIAIGGDLRTATFHPQDICISKEVSEYVRAWGNFDNTTDYRVIIQDETKGDIHLNADPIMLWIALDTLLENAYRHGFREGNYTAPEGNLVCIRLNPVLMDEKPFVQIAVMNNGQKAPDGYTIEDFKTRGHYVGDSGHTGLGGNHVYTVAHRMGGFIAYRTEMNWPFIIDVLLPVFGDCSTEFNTPYEETFV